MGLDTSHNAWSGAYSSFHNWRNWLAQQYGIPLELMEGFYSEESSFNPFLLLRHKFPNGDELEMASVRRLQKQLPLKWSAFKKNNLHVLLHHSDCDGEINWTDCGKIADQLKLLISELPPPETESDKWMRDKTEMFMKGCQLAFKKKQKLKFH